MDEANPWTVLLLSLAGAAVGVFAPRGWTRRLRPWADRTVVGGIVVAMASLGVNAAVVAARGWPQPHVNDEYGYLLIADTFAHGRLANPTPADPDAFASPHVLLRPTYAAKYPPGQGVALLVGQLLGRPAVGVWVSSALAAVAAYWMLLAFVPPRWALLGGMVAATHPKAVEWGHLYWGGAVAELGGAVVVGAWGRLRQGAGVRPAVLLGVGLVVLANSRPYEGLVLAVPLMATLVVRRDFWRAATVVPLLTVLAVGGGLMLLYDVRVTGHAWELPFVAYAAAYDVAPKFWLLPLRAALPAYPNGTLSWMHAGFEVNEYRHWQTVAGAAAATGRRLADAAGAFARPGVLAVPFAFALGRARWAWVTLGVFCLGLWAETFFLHHYAAPAVGVLVVLLTIGWRRLHGWSPRLGRGLVVGYAVGAAVAAAGVDRDLGTIGHAGLVDAVPGLRDGRQLVFVRYAADHEPHNEWAYDGADPAGQRVLWVRWRGAAADRAVVRDYPGRTAWVVTVGRTDVVPQRYVP